MSHAEGRITTASGSASHAEGKEKLTIAIGCTGGQHRSVSIARQLAVDLAKKYPVDISHREISRYIGQ